MKVDPVASIVAQLARGGASLTIPDSGDFGARLTIGQLLKGRVLRSYDGNRHLVDFDGEQRVVDSAVPLRQDEVFVGRVVGLGDRVELRRLGAGEAPPPTPDAAAADARPRGGADSGIVAELFERYGMQLPAQALQSFEQLVARLPAPETAALAGLVLAKLGLPLAPELVRSLQTRLAGAGVTDRAPWPGRAVELETAEAAPALQAEAVAPLAAVLSGLLLDAASLRGGVAAVRPGEAPQAGSEAGTPVRDAQADAGGDTARQPPDVAQWILNAQTGGTVAHRLGRLALVVDGRLLEFEVALFEEMRDGRGGGAEDGLRFRQIALALDTASFGRVEVRAQLAGEHMRLSLATASSEATAALASHAGRLDADLRSLGWQVDGIDYATQSGGAGGAPLHSVVEHIISPGSVSRLV